MKDSGLSFLFRATEGTAPADEKSQEPEKTDAARRSLIQPSRTFPAVIRVVGVETGGSNIQFAVEPATGRMVAIEVSTENAAALLDAGRQVLLATELELSRLVWRERQWWLASVGW